MRFHHSTRRGRNSRLGQAGGQNHQASGGNRSARNPTSTSRWSQLGYCRETNIHFNRRLPIEPPAQSVTSDPPISHLHIGAQKLNAHLGRKQNQQQQQQQQQQVSITVPNLKQVALELRRMAITREASSLDASSPDSGLSGLSQEQQQQQQLQLQQSRSGAELDGLAQADFPRLIEGLNQDHQPSAEHQPAQQIKIGAEQQQQKQQEEELIDLESARQKLVAQVEKHPFWSNKAARRMQLTSLRERRIFSYELVSFCERRDLEWRFEPYRGGLVPSIPFRRLETVSQPSSPAALDPLGRRCIRVPRPQLSALSILSSSDGIGGAGGDAADSIGLAPGQSLTWSLAGSSDHAQHYQQRKQSTGMLSSSVAANSGNIGGGGGGGSWNTTTRRGRSATNSPTLTCSAAAGGANSLIEPAISSIKCKIPSAEYVWSIEAPAHLRPEPFVGQVHSCELPGSSFVKRCHGCQGRGRLKCASCYGVGYEVCISCSGKGTTRSQSALGGGSRINDRCRDGSYNSRNSHSASGYDDSDGQLDYRGSSSSESRNRGNEPGGISGGSSGATGGAWLTESCHFCHGAGQKRCWVCAGKSYNFCQGCLGVGQLRCYLNLSITWTNHRDESILNNSDQIIPRERLRLCSGPILIAEESQPNLMALSRTQIDGATGSPEDSNQLHLASRRLLDKHSQTYRHERLIKQRHKVTQIQCHVVNYEWKQRRGHFVIYGDERKVYIAKYPFKSICSIT